MGNVLRDAETWRWPSRPRSSLRPPERRVAELSAVANVRLSFSFGPTSTNPAFYNIGPLLSFSLAFFTTFPRASSRQAYPVQSMSFFKRRRNVDADQFDADDHDTNIDQDLRLRTVRTAASTIAESIASEQRAERRRSIRHKRSKFFRSKSVKHPPHEKAPASVPNGPTVQIAGKRRNVYVNMPLTAAEVDRYGEPIQRYARNKVKTTSESKL
jgi:hypothetical protein